jgi:hypothetical protein
VAYKSHQNCFLQSSCGHAASSKGAVITCLVWDVVYEPLDDVLDRALCLLDGQHLSLAYYDDNVGFRLVITDLLFFIVD